MQNLCQGYPRDNTYHPEQKLHEPVFKDTLKRYSLYLPKNCDLGLGENRANNICVCVYKHIRFSLSLKKSSSFCWFSSRMEIWCFAAILTFASKNTSKFKCFQLIWKMNYQGLFHVTKANLTEAVPFPALLFSITLFVLMVLLSFYSPK